jgi:hypothetical protein
VTPYNLVDFYRCSLTTYHEGVNKNRKRCKEKQKHRKYTQMQQAGKKRQEREGRRMRNK